MQTENVNNPQTKSKKAYLICFIFGCILGAISIIATLVTSIAFFDTIAQINAGQGVAAVVSILLIPAAIGCFILSVISIILLGFGIKWKKLPSILALVPTILITILLIVSLIMFFLTNK